MPDGTPQATDLWAAIEEAAQLVERWPAWMQRHDADIFHEGYAAREVTFVS